MERAYVEPGRFVNSDDPAVRAFAFDHVGAATDPVEQVVALFVAVRDDIWYDPFDISAEPAAYRASAVVASRADWCVPKAVLLAAAARSVGVPARLGFADVRNHRQTPRLRNHLQTPRLRERMGGADEFVHHGYTDLYVAGRWVKATPAFNSELCARFGVPSIAFDGVHDALMHPFSADGSRYTEYGRDRGTYADLPLDELLATFREVSPPAMFASARSGIDAFTAPAKVDG